MNREETPFVISMHHRCGSKWTANLFVSIFKNLGITRDAVDTTRNFSRHGSPDFIKFKEVKKKVAFIANCNYQYLPSGIRGINVYRDPRDMIVSCYFSHLFSHQTKDWYQLLSHRKFLEGVSEEEGINDEMDFSQEFIEDLGSFDFRDISFKHFDLMYIGRNSDSILLFIIEVLRHFGKRQFTTKESKFLINLADASIFSKLSNGREPGQEDQKHHFRNGKAGDWKNHFSELNKEKFKEKYNYILLRLGFEVNENW